MSVVTAAAQRLGGSVRLRTALAAALAVGVVLALSSATLLSRLHATMLQVAQATAQVRAEDAVTSLTQGRLPRSWSLPDEDTAFVQIVSGHRVLASTANLAVGIPLVLSHAGGASTVTGLRADPDADFRVVQRRVGFGGTTVIVTAGSSMDDAEDALSSTRMGLIAAVPLICLLVGVLTWVAAGRALRPVEAMRLDVDRISERELGRRELGRRVHVPPGSDEISRLALTMNGMLIRVEQSVSTQKGFVADASHELRNPLAALRAELEVALAQPDRANWPLVVTNALSDTVRIQRLTSDLLLLAGLDSRQPPLPERVDLRELARGTLPAHAAAGLELSLVAPDLVAVQGDPAHLRRLLDNLLDNAARHATRSVSVCVQRVGAEAVMSVADDGPGIAAADSTRIFQRFVRLDDARGRLSGGTGLGLAIAADIASGHHGTLESVPGGPGATFRLTLPVLQA